MRLNYFFSHTFMKKFKISVRVIYFYIVLLFKYKILLLGITLTFFFLLLFNNLVLLVHSNLFSWVGMCTPNIFMYCSYYMAWCHCLPIIKIGWSVTKGVLRKLSRTILKPKRVILRGKIVYFRIAWNSKNFRNFLRKNTWLYFLISFYGK